MIELEIINNEIRLVSKEKQHLALLTTTEAKKFQKMLKGALSIISGNNMLPKEKTCSMPWGEGMLADEIGFVAAYLEGRSTVKFSDLDKALRNEFKRQPTNQDLSSCLKSFGWEHIRTKHERFWASPAEIEDRKTRACTAAENLAERKQKIFDLMAKIDRKNEAK